MQKIRFNGNDFHNNKVFCIFPYDQRYVKRASNLNDTAKGKGNNNAMNTVGRRSNGFKINKSTIE